jgi:hypothetical protein
MVPLTETMVVNIEPGNYPTGDPRHSRNGQPLAYNFELTATRLSNGQPITGFSEDAVLIWNVDNQSLGAAGVYGFPLYAYTYNEQEGYWQKVRSEWNPQTSQLIALTPHFSSYAVGGGFDAINNYLPSVKDFETDLQTGAATANYPIDLPSGPGGFGPNLSLTYNSGNTDRVDAANQGTSPVGWGWNLGGVSYIAATQHYFNASKQPWTSSIVVDGVSGDLVKGTDGKWHSSNESFAKIEYDGAGGNRIDDKWTVWTKDGTKYEFNLNVIKLDAATGQQGWTTYKWMLSKATDVSGNVITYRYKFELQDERTVEVQEQSDEAQYTNYLGSTYRVRAVYPYQVKYGGYDGTNSKVLVEFSLASRTDYSQADQDSGLFQKQRIISIAVKRLQQGAGYATLRSYDFEQNYNIVIPVLGSPTPSPCPNYQCPHLTLSGITRKGTGTNGQQLPKTTFEYVRPGFCDSSNPSAYDKGKLCVASNGYGGSVVYYYDAAAGDLNQGYRRVRARRVKDGLLPTATPGGSTSHDSLYLYDHRGGHLNSRFISDECCGTYPIHGEDNEFRGYTWVREQDPSGQMTDHFYSQDDATKAKEWRSQTGKAETFAETMDGGVVGNPVADPDWVESGSVTHQTDPHSGTNGVWKVNPAVGTNASIERVSGVGYGYDVMARIMIKPNDVPPATPEPNLRLEGTWRLSANDNGDYWGLKIVRQYNASSQAQEYHAWIQWKANGGTASERSLGLLPGTQAPPAPTQR